MCLWDANTFSWAQVGVCLIWKKSTDIYSHSASHYRPPPTVAFFPLCLYGFLSIRVELEKSWTLAVSAAYPKSIFKTVRQNHRTSPKSTGRVNRIVLCLCYAISVTQKAQTRLYKSLPDKSESRWLSKLVWWLSTVCLLIIIHFKEDGEPKVPRMSCSALDNRSSTGSENTIAFVCCPCAI